MRLWKEFLLKQEREIGKETVDRWLRALKIVCFDACNLYLEAGNSFIASWFEEHIRHKLEAGFVNNNGKQIKIHLSTFKPSSPLSSEGGVGGAEFIKSSSQTVFFRIHTDSFSQNFRFESFEVSEGNELAYKLLKEAIFSKDATFNPVYLFGGSGAGKTHLLMAAAQSLLSLGKKVLYAKAETFTNNFVSAIRSGEMKRFREFYRKSDALFIDDIDVLSGKAATQEEFFHTFNSLHVEGKHLLLASRFSPQELKGIEERLVSRFEWGIVVGVQVLKNEDLMRFLKNQLSTHFEFSLDIIVSFLTQFFSEDIVRLVEIIDIMPKRLKLKNLKESDISFDKLKEIFKDFLEAAERKKLTPTMIISVVAQHYGIRVNDILSKSQLRENILPRQVAMHLCREYLALPYIKIGDIFARDHSTVMSSVKHIREELGTGNRELLGSLNLISKVLM